MHPEPARRGRGFTLVEMLAGMMGSSVLALTVGSLVVYGFGSWQQNLRAVELQRDGTLAMQIIGEALREASSASVQVAADRITVGWRQVVRGNDGVLTYDPDTRVSGNEYAVASGVSAMTSVRTADGVGVQLVLRAPADSLQMDGAWAFRN